MTEGLERPSALFTYSHVHNPCAARFERELHQQTAPEPVVGFVSGGDDPKAYPTFNKNLPAGGVIAIPRGGALTIEDSSEGKTGKIDAGTKAYAAVTLTQKGDDDSKVAALTLNGGTLSGFYYGIAGNGSRHGTAITINGGALRRPRLRRGG